MGPFEWVGFCSNLAIATPVFGEGLSDLEYRISSSALFVGCHRRGGRRWQSLRGQYL